jgi:hypothetical protein
MMHRHCCPTCTSVPRGGAEKGDNQFGPSWSRSCPSGWPRTRAACAAPARHHEWRIEWGEELRQRHAESSRELRHILKSRVPFPALDPADVRPVQTGASSEVLLCEGPCSSELPQPSPERHAHIHAAIVVVRALLF